MPRALRRAPSLTGCRSLPSDLLLFSREPGIRRTWLGGPLAVTRLEAAMAHEPSVRISGISFPDLPDLLRPKLDRESL